MLNIESILEKEKEEEFKLIKSLVSSESVHVSTKTPATGTEVTIGQERAPTAIGTQGVHGSAYLLFKTLVETTSDGKQIDDSIKSMIHIMNYYLELDESAKIIAAIKERFDESKLFFKQNDYQKLEHIGNLLESEEEKEIIEKAKAAVIVSNTKILTETLDTIVKNHLTLRNKVEMASFPEEGNLLPPVGEGPRVRNAAAFLSQYRGAINLEELEKTPEDSPATQSPRSFEQDELRKISEAITDLFWYPFIPDNVLINITTEKGRAEWEKVMTPNIHGKRKYNLGTIPRDNNPEKVEQVLKNHLELIFLCFDELGHNYENIIEGFVTKFNESQWGNKLNGESLSQKLKQHIGEKISLWEKMTEAQTTSESSGRRSSGSSAIQSGDGSEEYKAVKKGSPELPSSQEQDQDYNPRKRSTSETPSSTSIETRSVTRMRKEKEYKPR